MAPAARRPYKTGEARAAMAHEQNGVRVGLRVRDLDGKDLGKVTELYDWGFAVEKGFPILFRRDLVATYDEVRAVDGGVLTLARTSEDLDQLAAGELPRSWRIPVPRDFPAAATPPEARAVIEGIATSPRPAAPPAREGPPVTPGEERTFERSHGQERPDELGAPSDRAANV